MGYLQRKRCLAAIVQNIVGTTPRYNCKFGVTFVTKKKKLIDTGMGQRTIFGSDLLEKTDKKKGSATSV